MTLQDYSFNSGSAKADKMVVFLHGYGADGKDLISIAPMWADELKNTVFFAPNAPEPCEMSPMGFQWFSLMDRSEASMTAGAKSVRNILEKYIRQKLDDTGLQMKDVAIVGFSQGTMMALYTMPRLDQACAGVLGYSGRLVAVDSLKSEQKSKFPICAIHGTADEIVPFDSLAGIAEGFDGQDVKTHSRANLGHGIDDEGLRIGLQFLQKVLKT